MTEKKQKFEFQLVTKSITDKCFCSICESIISDPHQVSCCGVVACGDCISTHKDAGKPCWSCKRESNGYKPFQDKRFDKQVVKCPKGYKGCTWTGQFCKITEHLNPEPTPDRQLEGCQFYKIPCSFCQELFRRERVKDHQRKECPERPFTCEHCKIYNSTYDDVKNNHEKTCGDFKLKCPKGCGQKLRRKEIGTHPCPEDIIDCEFKYAGCKERMSRKKYNSHLKAYKYIHDSQHKTYKADMMRGQVAKQEEIRQDLNKVKGAIETLQDIPPACPVKLTFSHFSEYEQENKEWYSAPFCDAFQGHTMCLKVSFCRREIGDGRYITLTLLLRRGNFDDRLQWPLKAEFEVQLVKWGTEEGHHSTTMSFNDDTPQECSQRVREARQAARGVESKNFISLAQILHQENNYLKENKCCFLISKRNVI